MTLRLHRRDNAVTSVRTVGTPRAQGANSGENKTGIDDVWVSAAGGQAYLQSRDDRDFGRVNVPVDLTKMAQLQKLRAALHGLGGCGLDPQAPATKARGVQRLQVSGSWGFVVARTQEARAEGGRQVQEDPQAQGQADA